MVAKVAAGGSIGNLTTKAGLGGGTGGGIPFLIQGTTARPVFVPDAKGNHERCLIKQHRETIGHGSVPEFERYTRRENRKIGD
jgi:hypothetical protein